MDFIKRGADFFLVKRQTTGMHDARVMNQKWNAAKVEKLVDETRLEFVKAC